MPHTDALSPPARLVAAQQVVFNHKHAEVHGGEAPRAETPAVLDLDQVIGLRSAVEWDGDSGTPRDDQTTVSRRNDCDITVLLGLAQLAAMWRAYRDHADSLTRIRN